MGALRIISGLLAVILFMFFIPLEISALSTNISEGKVSASSFSSVYAGSSSGASHLTNPVEETIDDIGREEEQIVDQSQTFPYDKESIWYLLSGTGLLLVSIATIVIFRVERSHKDLK